MIKSYNEHMKALEACGSLPEGFSIGLSGISFFPEELETKKQAAMKLSLILMDKPSEIFAGVFTRNKFPGAPVILAKERMQSKQLRGIVINNKVANVCVPTGLADARTVAASAAACIGCPEHEILCASTGVIGWRLPLQTIEAELPTLVAAAKGDNRKNAAPLAENIMTTDRFAKLRSTQVNGGTIVAVAKGAGMIEPNMGTMLCFIMTDIAVPAGFLRAALGRAVAGSFNRISIDSDQSTSDMAIALSSATKPCLDTSAFETALTSVCAALAEDIVRNGEGVGHVIRATVSGAANIDEAAAIGKAVVNSLLVKTAIAGNDPNVGRIVSAIGDYCGNNGIHIRPDDTTIKIGSETIFANGCLLLDPEKEKKLALYLTDRSFSTELKGYPEHNKTVTIDINIGMGEEEASVLGGDLTHEYVRENAEYRS